MKQLVSRSDARTRKDSRHTCKGPPVVRRPPGHLWLEIGNRGLGGSGDKTGTTTSPRDDIRRCQRVHRVRTRDKLEDELKSQRPEFMWAHDATISLFASRGMEEES